MSDRLETARRRRRGTKTISPAVRIADSPSMVTFSRPAITASSAIAVMDSSRGDCARRGWSGERIVAERLSLSLNSRFGQNGPSRRASHRSTRISSVMPLRCSCPGCAARIRRRTGDAHAVLVVPPSDCHRAAGVPERDARVRPSAGAHICRRPSVVADRTDPEDRREHRGSAKGRRQVPGLGRSDPPGSRRADKAESESHPGNRRSHHAR